MNLDEFDGASDVFSAFEVLVNKGLFSQKLWRLFHCGCCKLVWIYFDDKLKKQGVHVGELYIKGRVSQEQINNLSSRIQELKDLAWSKVFSMRIPSDDSSYLWPISEDVDRAWLHYTCLEAVACCLLLGSNDQLALTVPIAAASLPAWANARPSVMSENIFVEEATLRSLVEVKFSEIVREEEQRQMTLLRDLLVETV